MLKIQADLGKIKLHDNLISKRDACNPWQRPESSVAVPVCLRPALCDRDMNTNQEANVLLVVHTDAERLQMFSLYM